MHGASCAAVPLVLIAEDYEDTRDLYALFLERAGFRVITARNGAEAVALAREAHPDVIVMDLGMPVMSGQEATEILKKDERTRDIVIVVVTGNGESANTPDALWDRFVIKPCRPQALADHVRDTVLRAA